MLVCVHHLAAIVRACVCTYGLNAAPAEVLKFDLTAVVHLGLAKRETIYALHFDARVHSYFGFFRGFIWSELNRNKIQQLPVMAHDSKPSRLGLPMGPTKSC